MLVVNESNATTSHRNNRDSNNHIRVAETRVSRSKERSVGRLSAANAAFLQSMGFAVPRFAR